ncbi:hypothetical protein HNY73_015457 [Argiope bruennichi]|uniref:Uncharacterized protein n=1 Tax=Argiope bruennichi TaxID=94029 RepID=A0A8T0ES26_ARGBR|nr:hypothetical protein HNY73_015457 [Argiope bruennichi]
MNTNNETGEKKKNNKLLETSFLLTVTGVSILGGFGMALALAKKRDPVYFFKAPNRVPSVAMPEMKETVRNALSCNAMRDGEFHLRSEMKEIAGSAFLMRFGNVKDFCGSQIKLEVLLSLKLS